MYSTVKGILENLLFLVKKYGFIPNGGRIYYTERSQPPFITLMTEEYIKATGKKKLVFLLSLFYKYHNVYFMF